MDERYKNIFYGLVTNENSTTELFCNLFQFKPFKTAILELFLERDLIERIKFDDCRTQQRLDECGCPDLIISNDEVEIIFEVKIGDTSLTDNQPKGYLKHFEKPEITQKKHKWLILLIPDDYYYKEEWGRRVPMKIKKEMWLERVPIVLPNIDIKIYKIYWTQVIHQIEEYDLPSFSQYFNDFVALLKRWFEREPIIFTNREVKLMFSDEVPKVVTKLFAIIDDVHNDISREFGDTIRILHRINEDEAGLYIKNQMNQEFLFFGVWYHFWEKYKRPLCYGVSGKYHPSIVNVFKQSHDKKIQKEEGWFCTWIDENIIQKENCQKDIASLIMNEVKNLLPILET